MKITPTALKDVWLITPERFHDARGYFCETFRLDAFEVATGIRVEFVQFNESLSSKGVVRGLHYQAGEASQAKLVRVTEGRILDIAVDLRRSSPTYGHHICVELSGDEGTGLFIPRGFAHGFAVLSESARFNYMVDNYYNRASERTIRPDDATLGICWPLERDAMILSEKDRAGESWEESEKFD